MYEYDRYSTVRSNNKVGMVPYVKIPKKDSDILGEIYRKNQTRLDLVSYKYYGDPGFAWLILQANPELGSLEYEIEDGSEFRVPYPLDMTLKLYTEALERLR